MRELGLRAGDPGLQRFCCLSSFPTTVPANTGRPCAESRRGQCQKHMALSGGTRVEKCKCVSVCVTTCVTVVWVYGVLCPPQLGAPCRKGFLIGNYRPHQLWENSFSRDSLLIAAVLFSPCPPRDIWSTFVMKGKWHRKWVGRAIPELFSRSRAPAAGMR